MAEQKKVICKVLRPFKYEGKVLKAGSTQELPEIFANAMQAANKVEFSGGKPAEKSEAVDPLSPGHKSGGKK